MCTRCENRNDRKAVRPGQTYAIIINEQRNVLIVKI